MEDLADADAWILHSSSSSSHAVELSVVNKCKKLNSLKHHVRSQITRLKLQKSFCDLEHGVLL